MHLLGHKRDPMRFCKPLVACLGQVALPCSQEPSLRRLTAEADHIEPVSADKVIRLPSGLLHIDKGCILLGIQRRRHLIPSEGGMAGKVGAEALFHNLGFVRRTPFCQKHSGQAGPSLQQCLRNETSCRRGFLLPKDAAAMPANGWQES